MFSLSRRFVVGVMLFSSGVAMAQLPLRVCSDPDDMPFSTSSRSGFDNKIAELLGEDLHRPVVFVWARARRGFLRERFNSGACDMLMGAPQGIKHVRTTIPYYRSSYVFVTRKSSHLQLTRFDDPAIGRQRIGLQILEEDYAPPSLPLIRAGHAAQFVGFDSFGNGGARIIHAVADHSVGLAVVWGPLAGYYAAKQKVPLTLSAVKPAADPSGIPFSFPITIAVHKNDASLVHDLNAAIRKNKIKIEAILDSYHVPLDKPDGGRS